MAKDDTIYLGTSGQPKLKSVSLLLGGMRLLYVDVTPYIGSKSTTASSATWVADDGTVTIADAAISSGVTSAEVTAATVGKTTVKVSVTLANQEILVSKFFVEVSDPQAGAASDYRG